MSDSSNESEQAPWYRDGLQFTCSQCGDCCTGDPGVVWATEKELQEIAEYLDKPIGEIRLFHTRPVRGRVVLSMQRGEILVEEGKLKAKPGCGQFLRTDSGHVDPRELH